MTLRATLPLPLQFWDLRSWHRAQLLASSMLSKPSTDRDTCLALTRLFLSLFIMPFPLNNKFNLQEGRELCLSHGLARTAQKSRLLEGKSLYFSEILVGNHENIVRQKEKNISVP